MQLSITPAILKLLQDSCLDDTLEPGLRVAADQAAAAAAAAPVASSSDGGGVSIEWATLKALVQHRQAQGGAGEHPIDIAELCRGGGIAFPQPRRAAEGQMPEALRRHLGMLRARLEQQKYDTMVADVTQLERQAEAMREGGLVTYKQQLSFGLHILAMMAAFYALGHVAGMALTRSKVLHSLVGLAFMVAALLLETVLYIIRTTVPPKLHRAAARRAQLERMALQNERQVAALAAGADASAMPSGIKRQPLAQLAEDKKEE